MKKPNNKFWQELEKRFGKVETDVISKFEKSYFNGIKGWQYSEEELEKANKEGKLITMDLDFPGSSCKLDCVYCFAKAGEKTGTYYRPGEGDKPLILEEVKSFLVQAKKLGLKSIKVIGFREPFDNPGFYEFIDFCTKLGLHLVIFTSGYTLGEEYFGGDLNKAIDFLATRNVSLMIKLHTLNEEVEDKIVNYKGFSKVRNKIFN